MQVARIKRGATFKATLIFDEDEWGAIYPWDSIEADVGIWGRRQPLTISVDEVGKTITVTSDTDDWLLTESGKVPPYKFDVWVIKGGEKLPIPASVNIPLHIIEGVTH